MIDLVLGVGDQYERPTMKFHEQQDSAPIRPITNWSIHPDPKSDLSGSFLTFAGTDGRPYNLNRPSQMEGAFVGILSKNYAWSYFYWSENAPKSIALERKKMRVMQLQDFTGQAWGGHASLASMDLWAVPLVQGEWAPAAYYLGLAAPELEFDCLPSGRYRLIATQTNGAHPKTYRIGVSAEKVADLQRILWGETTIEIGEKATEIIARFKQPE